MTGQRGPQPQPGGGSGKLPCSRCGAWNYATDAVCLSCGAELDARRFHPASPPAERKPEGSPARESPVPALPDLPLSALGLDGWTVTRTAEGALRMVADNGWWLRRRQGALYRGLSWLFLGLYGWLLPAVLLVTRQHPHTALGLWISWAIGTIFLLAGGLRLASFCVWEEWIVGPDRLEVRRALFQRWRESCYTQARLEVRDELFGNSSRYPPEWGRYRLLIHDSGGRAARLNSARLGRSHVCALARFLAEQTGWPLSGPRWLF